MTEQNSDARKDSMTDTTTPEQIESRVQARIERSIRLHASLREAGVDDMDDLTPEEKAEMQRSYSHIERVYAQQRDRDVQREEEKGMGRSERISAIRDEEAKISMAWTVRYHTLARTGGRASLETRAAHADGWDTDSQNWEMVGHYIEEQQSEFERSLGLDPDAERELEREVEAAREESDDPRAYDPLQEERFRQRILDYEQALSNRAFVLLNRLDRDFDNAYHKGEVDLYNNVPQYLFWTTPLWAEGDEVDGRYVFRDLPPASLS